jgi:uncharacterized protein YjiS (DUF1127 family)
VTRRPGRQLLEREMRANGVTIFEVDRSAIVRRMVDGLVNIIARYRKYREELVGLAMLRGMSDRELKDIGVYRCDIDRIARQK